MALIGDDELGVDAGFTEPELNANPCEFVLVFPVPKLTINIPGFAFPPELPIPKWSFNFRINCSLDNPLDVSSDLEWGGGKKAKFDPDPDNEPD